MKTFSPEERVLARIRESRELIDANPAAVWNRAVQALNLLGRADLPNGVADFEVRTEARKNVLFIGSRILVDGSYTSGDRDEIVRICLTASDALGSSHTRAYRELVRWATDSSDSPLDLLDTLLAPDGPRAWLGNSLSAAYQTLQNGIELAASDPHEASRFHGEVHGWLELSGFTGDVKARADDLRISAFETLLKLGNRDSAVRILQAVDAAVAERTATIREREQRWFSAVLLYERSGMNEAADMARSTGIQALLESGESMLDSESYSEALEAFNTVLVLDEDNLEALDFRGECLYELREYERALADYTRILEDEGSYEDADQVYYGRALAHADLWQFDLALDDCIESIRLEPDDVDVRILAAQLCLQVGRLEECMEHSQYAIGLAPDSMTCHLLMGASHLGLGDLKQALKYTLMARDLGQPDANVECKLGEIYSGLADFEPALTHLNRAVELNPDLEMGYFYRAYVHHETGKPNLALEDMNTGLTLDPDGNPIAYYHRAQIHMALENFEQAVEDCTVALSKLPESVGLYSLRMQANYDAADLTATLRDCRAALRVGGDNEELYVKIGHVYLCMLKPELAMREGFNRALELNPDSPGGRGGAFAARMLLEGAIDTRGNRDPFAEPLTPSARAFAWLASSLPPPGSDDELSRLVQDSSLFQTFQLPKSIMSDEPDLQTKGDEG